MQEEAIVQEDRSAPTARSVERDAMRILPLHLAGFLGQAEDDVQLGLEPRGGPGDIGAEAGGLRWLFQVKTSSQPGIVASVADRLVPLSDDGTVAALVVPYMTPAGAKTAQDRGLNWLDLSGNACMHARGLHVSVEGRANAFTRRGRPASAFAPKSSRLAHALLLDPMRWWRQKDLALATELDDGHVSRIVRRLADDELVIGQEGRWRPRDPSLLLDAWAGDYRFDRHDIVIGHATGSGMELAREIDERLSAAQVDHAFTGLVSAWTVDPFARFRLNTVFVRGDPVRAADAVGLRRNERGANVQLVCPIDQGVFIGRSVRDHLSCVSPVQTYLDLLSLPERAADAAHELRERGRLWDASV